MEKYIDIIIKSYSSYWNYLKYELISLSHWDNYFYGLIAISLLVWILEIAFPWRKLPRRSRRTGRTGPRRAARSPPSW